MNRRILVFLAVLSIAFALQAYAQTVDDIIAKNIKAHGGLDKLKAVKTMRMTGKMMMQQGMETPFVYEKKRPDKIRIEFTMQGMTGIQAFDGTTAWGVMPFMGVKDPQKLGEDDAKDIKQEGDFDGPLVDYKAKGNTVELMGKDDVEGTQAYKIKLTLKDGDVRYIFLDADNFLELKTTSIIKREGREATVDTYFGDYKTVNGLVLPHTMESKIGDQQGPQYIVEKVEMDVDLSDDLFKMPAAAQPQSAPATPGR